MYWKYCRDPVAWLYNVSVSNSRALEVDEVNPHLWREHMLLTSCYLETDFTYERITADVAIALKICDCC